MSISERTMELLKMARCADICDALDSMGLQDQYEMDLNMRPLFPGIKFCGIARTQEFDRFDYKLPAMSYEDFEKKQYSAVEEGGYSAYSRPGVEELNLQAGEVLVIAAHGARGGILGSENTLRMINQGVCGFIVDGTMRDSREAIMQKAPVFSTVVSYTHPMGRIRIKSSDKPVTCAGVYVCSGDVIVADDDGVIVVPQRYADEVAVRAYKIQQIDRRDRRRNFINCNMQLDETTELLPDLD